MECGGLGQWAEGPPQHWASLYDLEGAGVSLVKKQDEKKRRKREEVGEEEETEVTVACLSPEEKASPVCGGSP